MTDVLASLPSALAASAPGADPTVWVPAMTPFLRAGGLSTPHRLAAFLGQCVAEAGSDFSELSENLRYTTVERILKVFPGEVRGPNLASTLVNNPELLANTVYAGRNGNGPLSSGDGWRFRGAGLFNLTGRANHTEFGKSVGMLPEDAADFARTPKGATASAVWFWGVHGCNDLADGWQLRAITRIVNGPALEGLDTRISAANLALDALTSTT